MKTLNGTCVYARESGTTFFERNEKVIIVSSSHVRSAVRESLHKPNDVDLSLSYTDSFPEISASSADIDPPCNHKMRIPKARKKDASSLLLATVARFKVK